MDLKLLFKNNIPLIDVRAPIEFEAASFPNAINLPILNNEERHEVGTCYKKSGKEEAIKLGHKLVSGEIKESRVNAWKTFIEKNPNAILTCFRGGLRSQTAQKWLKEFGVDCEIISGGTKRCRQFLRESLNDESFHRKFLVITGKTGSGKTALLKKFKNHFLDLEFHANHKGSSFGSMGHQPTQTNFENRLSIDLLKLEASRNTLIESESVMIGGVYVPSVLFEKMSASPMILIERSLEERVKHIILEYVTLSNHTEHFFITALRRLEKKLGGLQHRLIKEELEKAFKSNNRENVEAHYPWVEKLLTLYYDPYYEKSLKKNESKIIFKGSDVECSEFINSQIN